MVSSIGHRRGVLDVASLQGDGGYQCQAAYIQSKLANLMFSYEHRYQLPRY